MKPTPSQVALLLSTAGLGLSWSGAALASHDNLALPNVALTFGIAPRDEGASDPGNLDGAASWLPADGELLKAVAAKAATLPLPMPTDMSDDTPVLFRALDGRATAAPRLAGVRTGDDGPKPNHEEPFPEASIAQQVTDGARRDWQADATEMPLRDHPEGAVEADSWSAFHSTYVAPLTSNSAAAETLLANTQAAKGSSVAPASATPGQPEPAKTGGAPTKAKNQDKATKASTTAESESLDRIFASLAEVLGSQLEEQQPGLESSPAQTTAPKQDVALRTAAVVAAVDSSSATPASTADAAGNSGAALLRLTTADDIVVAPSHSDKVLMNLAALRSGDKLAADPVNTHMKRAVVARHADKVLETLALFKSRQPTSDAIACTHASGEEALAFGLDQELNPIVGPAIESAVVPRGAELDIDLDALQQPTRDADGSMEKAELARHTPSTQESEEVRSDQNALGSNLVALSAEKLDEVRGGFTTDTGLKISFGIERAVYLNGDLVTTTSLNIADLSKISGGQAQVTGDTAGALALVQSGNRNIFLSGAISTTAAGMVIQNTLDNQKINTITRIDAVVNSSSILRSMNLESSMRSALIDSLRR